MPWFNPCQVKYDDTDDSHAFRDFAAIECQCHTSVGVSLSKHDQLSLKQYGLSSISNQIISFTFCMSICVHIRIEFYSMREALLKQTLFQHISAKSVFLSKAKHPKQTKRNLNGFMSGVLGEKEW